MEAVALEIQEQKKNLLCSLFFVQQLKLVILPSGWNIRWVLHWSVFILRWTQCLQQHCNECRRTPCCQSHSGVVYFIYITHNCWLIICMLPLIIYYSLCIIYGLVFSFCHYLMSTWNRRWRVSNCHIIAYFPLTRVRTNHKTEGETSCYRR